jgi:hypothetical protein
MRGIAITLGIFLCLSLATASLSERYSQFKLYAAEYNKRY